MRLFGVLRDGITDADRAQWLTQPFDAQFVDTLRWLDVTPSYRYETSEGVAVLTLAVTGANNMDPAVFQHLLGPSVPGSGDRAVRFQKVCTAVDMAHLPTGAPFPDADPQWFRLAAMTFAVRSRRYALDTQALVLSQLQSLLDDFAAMDVLQQGDPITLTAATDPAPPVAPAPPVTPAPLPSLRLSSAPGVLGLNVAGANAAISLTTPADTFEARPSASHELVARTASACPAADAPAHPGQAGYRGIFGSGAPGPGGTFAAGTVGFATSGVPRPRPRPVPPLIMRPPIPPPYGYGRTRSLAVRASAQYRYSPTSSGSCRVSVATSQASWVDPAVFLYRARPPLAETGVSYAAFEKVCSPDDLEQFTAGAPVVAPAWFRMSTVTLDFADQATALSAQSLIVAQVQGLLDALADEDALEGDQADTVTQQDPFGGPG